MPPLIVELLAAPLDENLVLRMLREVIDPELGVNIVDLGLVYGVETDGGSVAITMTLTSPGCPLGGYMEDNIHTVLAQLPQVKDVGVEIVFEPPWTPDAMSEDGKAQLGWAL